MAVISASRRTDIPAFYSEWFLRRLESGEILVRNPFKQEQVSRIVLNKETIDCIVFWTKNPIPLISKLDRVKYPFYTQFTLTGYGRDMEMFLPPKEQLIEAFKGLSTRTDGRVIWRYDPIVFTPKYTPQYHTDMFEFLAKELQGYTKKCVISFVDIYSGNREALNGAYELSGEQLEEFCKRLADTAHKCGMEIATCAEKIDLDRLGIKHNKCIDPDYIAQILDCPIKDSKDGGQREACGCIESIDIGAYNTCRNGCKYCYACDNPLAVSRNCDIYDVNSPMLCDRLKGWERITDRKIKSVKDFKALAYRDQLTLF